MMRLQQSRMCRNGVRFTHNKGGQYLKDTVMKLDYDHYVCGLLFPQHKRDSYFAIRAMNAEVATIKDTIRNNPLSGKIRMQWWRDRINSMYNGKSHPEAVQDTLVLRSLHQAINECNLTRRWFERLLDARDEDLDSDHPQTLMEVESYANRTASSLLYLALECLEVRDNVADQAAGHAGIAIGLSTLLRGTSYHISRQQLYLPQDLLTKHNLTVDEVFRATESTDEATELGKKLAPVIFDVACRAMEHLHAARVLQERIPNQAKPALRSLIPTSLYLKQLENVDFNLFDATLRQSNPMQLHFQVLKHHFLKTY